MSGARIDRRTLQRRLLEGGAIVLGLATLLIIPAKLGPFPLPWPLALIWAAYAWSAAGPTIRAAGFLFVLGLWHDVLTGGPFGAWALVGLSAYGAALAQRQWVAFEGQAATFAGCGIAAIAAGLAGAILMLMRGDGMPTPLFFAQLAVTVMMFPLVGGAFALGETGDDE